MGAENAITVDCSLCAFVECRAVEPQSLLVDADVKHNGIDFLDVDNEVHIPKLVIGPRGNLVVVIHNRWSNEKNGAEKEDSYYSLLHHT